MAPYRKTIRHVAPRFTAPVAALVGVAVLAAPVRNARADEVSPTGKGITGGALLGAEVVTIVESIAGVRPGWAYAVGALVGAGGGGVGGYFVEQSSTDGKVPTYMLAGGLALVIPAIVLALNATRYVPEEGAAEDHSPTGPAAEPGTPGTAPLVPPPPPAAPPPAPTPATPAAPQPQAARSPRPSPALSLVNMDQGALRLGFPVVEVRKVFTVAEERQYGMKNDTELRMPVVHVSF